MKILIKNTSPARWALIGAATAAMISVGLSTAALAAGAHEGGHGSASMPMHGDNLNFGMPGKAADVSRTIDIVMEDNFFNHKTISVKAGETVRFKVLNKGTLLHEFGLGTATMHKKHQKQMMVMTEHGMIEADKINHDRMKMDHGGMSMMSHDDPNSLLLEPGKSGEIIWKFTKPTSLEFACNLPGHYESGMMGPIEFKK